MIILSLETATSICASALIENGECTLERVFNSSSIHSEKLLTLIDEVLLARKLRAKDIDAVAVSIGPGSFTGLRIGLSTAKGFAYAHDRPIIAVSTLEALGWSAYISFLAREEDLIVPIIDAHRDDIYCAGYRIVSGQIFEVIPVQAILVERLEEMLSKHLHLVLMGDGVDKFLKYCQKFGNKRIVNYIIPPLNKRLCSAKAVGIIGNRKIGRNEIADIESLEPFYVKDFRVLT